MDRPHTPDTMPIELNLAQLTAPHGSNAAAGTPEICAQLDRYDIAVILKATYEWGGYSYTNASDAIAAAKRAAK